MVSFLVLSLLGLNLADLASEPSNMLDVPSITFLSNYLQHYPNTVLVVSHDRAFLNEVATDIVHQHSERLDYYKGADFGKAQVIEPRTETDSQVSNQSERFFLRDEGRAAKNCQTRVRKPDGPTSPPPNIHRQVPV